MENRRGLVICKKVVAPDVKPVIQPVGVDSLQEAGVEPTPIKTKLTQAKQTLN